MYCNCKRNAQSPCKSHKNLQRDFPLLGEIMKWHIYFWKLCLLFYTFFYTRTHRTAHRCVNQIDSLFVHCCNNKRVHCFCLVIMKGSKKGISSFQLWWHIMFCGEDTHLFIIINYQSSKNEANKAQFFIWYIFLIYESVHFKLKLKNGYV